METRKNRPQNQQRHTQPKTDSTKLWYEEVGWKYCRQHLRVWTLCQNSSYDAVQPITIITITHT